MVLFVSMAVAIRSRRLFIDLLIAKDIEHNCGTQRVANEADFAFEIWISLYEQLVYPIDFLEDNPRNVTFICWALVQEDIKG